jgi:tetratricopeptide (TPR) repeat protein
MSHRLALGRNGLILAVVCWGATAHADVEQFLAAGDEALAKFELQAAVDAYREARHLAPDNYEAAWKFSRALANKATLSRIRAEEEQLCIDAETAARDAVRLNPKDSKGYVCLAIAVGKRALFEGGKRKVQLSKEVKTEADKAIELNPKEDLAYHVLGVWNREMVELNWMLKKFAEMFYGRFPPASLDEALKDLRKACELAPNVVSHQVELGITLAAARKWSESKSTLDHALAMPKTWVTDDYYKGLAKQKLDAVKAHLD